jgi:polysaccharide biosynthesis protein PslH
VECPPPPGAHRIHLGCFIDDPADRQHLAVLAAHCADLACLPLDPRTQRLKALLRRRPGQPLSLGFAFERLAAARFDHSLFVSEHEWQRFVALAPEAAQRTRWISNGVDFGYSSPSHDLVSPFIGGVADLVFTGRMDYRPNIDAVQWFARDVMPVLRHRVPAARFWIVAAAPTSDVRALTGLPGVEVTGRVPDTRPYLTAADVVVAPLRIARGIQNKLLEAMAMARPVVATPEAFQGVRAEPGRDILLASGIAETVQRIADVLDGRHATMGAAARRAVEAVHQWLVTLRPLDRLFAVAQPEPAQVELPA